MELRLRQRFPGHDPRSLTFIEVKLANNPTLERSDPSYRSSLMAMTRVERERLLRGNWRIRESRAGVIWQVHRDTNEYHEEDRRWADRQGAPGEGDLLRRLGLRLGAFEWGQRPLLWIEWDLWWQQTAAADVREKLELYPAGACHFGDPAGIQRESDQSSWEENLRLGGVPMMRLHYTEAPQDGKRYRWDTREGIEWMIKQVQLWLDEGQLLIHRRCRYLWSCLESWSWNIPEGAEVDGLSRTYIGPRKDVYSNGGECAHISCGGCVKCRREHSASRAGKQQPPVHETPTGLTLGERLRLARRMCRPLIPVLRSETSASER